MEHLNDNELTYVEKITIELIIRDIVGRIGGMEVQKSSKILIDKIDKKIIILLSLVIIDEIFIFEKCKMLQKKIIDEIKWMIHLEVCEINFSINKIIYRRK